MQIWKLTPLDLGDPNWEASSHRGIAIVRAKSEKAARAAAAFDIAVRFPPGKGVRTPPSARAALVKVEPIEDPRYDLMGLVQVLEPPS